MMRSFTGVTVPVNLCWVASPMTAIATYAPPAAPDVVTCGETMAMLTTPRGERIRHASSLQLSTGGSESNVAVGLRRLGRSVVWFGRVGDDEFGARVVRELRAEDVQVRVVVDPERPTGLMVKERRTANSTRVGYYRAGSAGSRLDVTDLDDDVIASARVLHVTGITAGLSVSAEKAVWHAVTIAHDAGVTVSLDLNHRAAVWHGRDYSAAMRDLVSRCDIVFGSPHEFDHVTGLVGSDAATSVTALAAYGPRQSVLTLGGDGAVAWVDGQVHRAIAHPVDVVDTVGAGDAFVAGWLAGWLDDSASVENTMATAVACGALACTVPGDWEGAATRADIAALQAVATDIVQR